MSLGVAANSRSDRAWPGPASQRAFTLVELLVSTALILAVVAVATTAAAQLLTQTRRLQARLALDGAAATAHTRLGGEVGSMHPCAAVWLSSSASPRTVELVFMRNTYSSLDWPNLVMATPFEGGRRMTQVEQVWTRWFWNGDAKTLEIASSRPVRAFRIAADQTRNYWQITGGSKMPASIRSTFIALPQLQRDDPGKLGAQAVLDRNAWQSGEVGDVGDHQDLLHTSRSLLVACSDLAIELGRLGGGTWLADGNTDELWVAPGSFIDGRQQSGLTDRPSLVRLRFTLTDEATGAVGTYSLSFTTPSQTAY